MGSRICSGSPSVTEHVTASANGKDSSLVCGAEEEVEEEEEEEEEEEPCIPSSLSSHSSGGREEEEMDSTCR
jgi:hypothetical protein